MNGKANDPKKCHHCGGALIITAGGCARYGITEQVLCTWCGYKVNAGHSTDREKARAAAVRKYWQCLLAMPDPGDPVARREVPEEERPRVTVSNDPNDDPVRGSYRKSAR